MLHKLELQKYEKNFKKGLLTDSTLHLVNDRTEERLVGRRVYNFGDYKIAPPCPKLLRLPTSVCEQGDPKRLYKLARARKIKGFIGVDDPYETPPQVEIVMKAVNGLCASPQEMTLQLLGMPPLSLWLLMQVLNPYIFASARLALLLFLSSLSLPSCRSRPKHMCFYTSYDNHICEFIAILASF